MSLAAGSRLGPYEIVSPLGAGGMGEVYRAHDTRLERTVAIKVLPQQTAGDPEFRERFEREARAVSSLDHPHICALYDVGLENGVDFLVMQFLDGETLAERLKRGPLPLQTAVRYAIEIANALDTAHRRGIVHRDLKPGNIMLTKTGAILLDFGLAKLQRADAIVRDGVTELTAVTARGAVLGTPQYMAPEQVRGQTVDHRADVFAFGLVLYEMLSGKRAFRGESQVEVLNAVLNAEPPELERPDVPIAPGLSRIVTRCLEKNPADRFQSASDLAFALESMSGFANSQTAAFKQPSRVTRRERMAWSAVGVLLLALIGGLSVAVRSWQRVDQEVPVVRFSAALPEHVSFYSEVEANNLSVSPDGRRLAFVAMAEGRRALWVRPLETNAAKELPGTEGASSPFWSPDSRYIAFFADGKLKRIDPLQGSLQTISDLPVPSDVSGSWGRDNVIIFVEQFGEESRLFRVAATGGTASMIEGAQPSVYWSWVYFLPDGRHYLVHRANQQDPSTDGIYVRSVDSDVVTRVSAIPFTRVEYAGGYLLYAREGNLLAQRFDDKALQLQGEPFTVVTRLPFFDKTGWAGFSVSNTGLLAYLSDVPMTQLTWVDRNGRELGSITEPGLHGEARLSPDGQKIALRINDPRTMSGDLWVHDVPRGTATRIVFGAADDSAPVWSPDGLRLAYFSCCEGKSTLYLKDVSDAGRGKALLDPGFQIPLDWSSDGRFIVFVANRDLWVLSLEDQRKPHVLLATPFSEGDARFSPDARWVAYASNETGRHEVYVANFSRPQDKWRISTAGGTRPRWRRDGKELFFLSAEQRVMTVSLKPGATFEYNSPSPLFRHNAMVDDVFDVSADGQRFLVASSAGQREPPFTVVLNWTADLRR